MSGDVRTPGDSLLFGPWLQTLFIYLYFGIRTCYI